MKKILVGLLFLSFTQSVFSRDTLGILSYHANINVLPEMKVNPVGFSALEYTKDMGQYDLGVLLVEAPAWAFESLKDHALVVSLLGAFKCMNRDDQTLSFGAKLGLGTQVNWDASEKFGSLLMQLSPYVSYKYHVPMDPVGLFLELGASIPVVYDMSAGFDLKSMFKGLNVGLGLGSSF